MRLAAKDDLGLISSHHNGLMLLCIILLWLFPSGNSWAQDATKSINRLIKEGDSIYSIDAMGARKLYEAAVNLAESQEPKLRGRAKMAVARYYDRIYQVDSAMMIIAELEKSGDLKNDSLALGEYYYLNASINLDEDKIDICSQYYDSALTVFDRLGEETRKGKVYNSIGIMYDLRDRHEVAKEYYHKGLEIFKRSKSYRLMGHIYNNLAGIYKYEEKLDICLAYYDSCQLMYKQAGDDEDLATVYNNISLVYIEGKDLPKAKQMVERGISFSTKLPHKYNHAVAYRNAAMYHFEAKEYEPAEKYARQALGISRNIHSNFLYGGVARILIKVLEATGQYKEAFNLSQEFTQWNDSVYNQQNTARLTELEAKYETQKKEMELAEKDVALAQSQVVLQRQAYLRNGLLLVMAALVVIAIVIYRGRVKQKKANDQLQKTNQEIERQKLIIEQNLREKEGLLREIHHRVKNNLQVISSLLNMQSHNLDDPGMISAIAEGQSRVKAMALIHQKLYQTDQLSEIDFQEYTEQLIGHLGKAFGRSDKNIKSWVNASNIKFDIDTAIPLGLILNELVTNAYKYAFEGLNEGDLKVELQKDESNTYQLRVTDNGKGLPIGFDETRLNSLGLKLVRMLIDQLDGSLTISSDHGTSFFIHFKDAKLSA